jgi:hypothetical protein
VSVPWRWVLAIVAVGVALRWPALSVGFAMDDWAQLAMLDGSDARGRAWYELFVFADAARGELPALLDRGTLPWWTDPELELAAMRPLSAALVVLDVRWFGHDPWPMHLHSLIWWIAMLLVAGRLLLQVLPARWALLTFALFVLDECHGFPLAWLANRNAIVAATFGFAAVLEHLRWREHAVAYARWTATPALALALTAGEYGLCAAAYLAAYELVSVRAHRLRALVPTLVVLLAWALLHRLGGYGSFASGAYLDPASEPIAWLAAAAIRMPVLIAGFLLALPTGTLALYPGTLFPQVLAGVLAALGLAALLPAVARRLPPESRARLRWLVLAMLLAILPVLSSFVSARVLVVPALAGHAVLAAVILDGLARARVARLRAALAIVLLLAHLGLATAWGRVELHDVGEVNRRTNDAALHMPVDDARIAEQRLVVLTANDPSTLLYPPLQRHFAGSPLPRAWWVLSMAPHPHRLHRIAVDAFELEVEGGAMLRGGAEQLLRRPDRLPSNGDVLAVDGLTITICAVDAEGFPTRVRYAFDRPLEDGSLVFLLVARRGIIRYPLGPVGSSVPIPAGALPLELTTPPA